MQVVNLIQGSPEWHAHRRNHFNASDAPAMLGVSKYTTRDQLLHQYATGLTKEVDAGTQKLFDDGHKFEALARQLAEKIIGDELSPMVATEGKLSASFDGITFEGDVIFEHKTLNNELRAAIRRKGGNANDFLAPMYKIQMEQQLMISGADKCLFMASSWDGDALIEERHCWYTKDLELRKQIITGWDQFERDLASYVPPVQVEKVVAETVEALPVPSVVVKGELVSCNLDAITPRFDQYLANINTTLATDQDFANAEADAKNCRESAKKLDAVTEAIISQMGDVNRAITILGEYSQKLNKMGLQLEKAVKEQKESVKTQAIMKAKQDYSDFVTGLQTNLVVVLHRHLTVPDFAGAIKSVKTIASMHSRINDALAAGKAQAKQFTDEVRTKVEFINVSIEGYAHLINIAELATKDMDYIKLHIQSVKDAEDKRKAEHEAAIKAKAEAEARAKLEAEQRAKEQAQPINEAKPEVAQREAVTLPGQEQLSETESSLAPIHPSTYPLPVSVFYPLFEHMINEHGLTLLESELQEIVRISVLVNDRMHQNTDLFEQAA